MARWWLLAPAGILAAAVAFGGCNRGRGVLDPGGPGALPGGGGAGGGGVPGHGAAVGPTDGPTPSGDGGIPPADGAVPATDAAVPRGDGGITTAPPTSACAMSPGRLPQPPRASPNIPSCSGALPLTTSMARPPAAPGQAYWRCGTLGPETSWQVTLSPDARYLAARTASGTVRLYQTDVWREIAQLASPVGRLDAVAFSPDGSRLATVSSEMGQVTLWNVEDGWLIATFQGPVFSNIGWPSSALAFSSDGRRLATSLGLVIDVQTGAMTVFTGQRVDPYTPLVNPAGTTGRGGSTYSLRFVGCDQKLLVHSAAGSGMLGLIEDLRLVDLASGASTPLAGGRFADLGAIVASPDGRWVAFVQRGDTRRGLHLYDAAGATLVAFDPDAPPWLAGFSRAGDRLFVVTGDIVQVRRVPTLELLGQTPLPRDLWGAVKAVAVSPRDEVIVSTSGASIWFDPATAAVNRRQSFAIGQAQFSADGRYGASDGSGPTLFQLWREGDQFAAACAPVAAPPERAVAGVALSQDGKTLALADLAGTTQVRPVSDAGEIGPVQATVSTGVVANPNNIGIAVANGGGRVALLGSPWLPAGVQDPGVLSRVVVADAAGGTLLFARDVSRSGGRLALSPDGTSLAFQDGNAAQSEQIAVSVDTGATMLSFPVGGGYLIDSFSADSKRLAVSSSGGIGVWQIASGTYEGTYARDGSTVSWPALSPDWSMMAGVVSPIPIDWNQRATLVWHPGDGSVVGRMGMLRDMYAPPCFDSSNAVLATLVFGTHTLSTNWSAWHVWSVPDGAVLRVFRTSSEEPQPLVAFPGGRKLLTRDGTALAVWCR